MEFPSKKIKLTHSTKVSAKSHESSPSALEAADSGEISFAQELESFNDELDQKFQKFQIDPKQDNVRVDPRVRAGSIWGSGLDEPIATRTLVKMANEGTFNEMLFKLRVPNSRLTWVVEPDKLKPGKKDSAIQGHVPSIKYEITNDARRHNMAVEHPGRDENRAQAVKGETDPHAMYIKGLASTAKFMMSTGEEFIEAKDKIQKQKTPTYSIFDPTHELHEEGQLEKFAMHRQNDRETVKWWAASHMADNGFQDLVNETHLEHINKSKENPAFSEITSPVRRAEWLHNAFQNEPPKDFYWNTKVQSDTDDLHTKSLEQIRKSTVVDHQPRVISLPRRATFLPPLKG